MNRAGNVYGRSWFPGTASTGGPSETQERVRTLVLGAPAPVGQVAGGDDEVRAARAPASEGERVGDLGILACPGVEIGNMEDACGHERMRL